MSIFCLQSMAFPPLFKLLFFFLLSCLLTRHRCDHCNSISSSFLHLKIWVIKFSSHTLLLFLSPLQQDLQVSKSDLGRDATSRYHSYFYPSINGLLNKCILVFSLIFLFCLFDCSANPRLFSFFELFFSLKSNLTFLEMFLIEYLLSLT